MLVPVGHAMCLHIQKQGKNLTIISTSTSQNYSFYFLKGPFYYCCHILFYKLKNKIFPFVPGNQVNLHTSFNLVKNVGFIQSAFVVHSWTKALYSFQSRSSLNFKLYDGIFHYLCNIFWILLMFTFVTTGICHTSGLKWDQVIKIPSTPSAIYQPASRLSVTCLEHQVWGAKSLLLGITEWTESKASFQTSLNSQIVSGFHHLECSFSWCSHDCCHLFLQASSQLLPPL